MALTNHKLYKSSKLKVEIIINMILLKILWLFKLVAIQNFLVYIINIILCQLIFVEYQIHF